MSYFYVGRNVKEYILFSGFFKLILLCRFCVPVFLRSCSALNSVKKISRFCRTFPLLLILAVIDVIRARLEASPRHSMYYFRYFRPLNMLDDFRNRYGYALAFGVLATHCLQALIDKEVSVFGKKIGSYLKSSPSYVRGIVFNILFLGIHGTPPIVFSLCFLVNLIANQRGDYECMRCRHTLMIQICAAVAKKVAVTEKQGKIRSSIYGKLCLKSYQSLTAVMFDMCLKKLQRNIPSPIVLEAWYRSEC